VDHWSSEEELDLLEEDFAELVPVATRGRRDRKKTPPRIEDEGLVDERKEDRRRRRRWDAPPHKRVNDYDAS
jgi:hypothetical protein